VRPCIGCNQGCVAGIRTPVQRMLCTVNPAVGFETTLSEDFIAKAAAPKKVVIVGGGPAGMEAARVAALSGHKVVLFEAQRDLGGMVNIAKRAPKLSGIADITVWLAQEVYRLGVDVRLSTYAELSDVMAERPDAVIVATGAQARRDGRQASCPGLPITGVDQPHVYTPRDIFDVPAAKLGKRAAVLDDVGHYEAIGVAEHLLAQGLHVTFVTRHSSFAPQMEAAVRSEPALKRLRKAGGMFALHVRGRLVDIGQGTCKLGWLEGEETWTVPADAVVLVLHGEPDNALYREMGGGTRAKQDFALKLVGDANSPRDVLAAIREGHMAARFAFASTQ
jgi:NADPH-dependent 2,4-dienoyl-CoA reductase/sulfur reductase-like enzyme